MKKNSLDKGNEIRSDKKFNTTSKPKAPLLSSDKTRKSLKNNTKRSNKEEEIDSPQTRKSARIGTVKKTMKKNSLFNKKMAKKIYDIRNSGEELKLKYSAGYKLHIKFDETKFENRNKNNSIREIKTNLLNICSCSHFI